MKKILSILVLSFIFSCNQQPPASSKSISVNKELLHLVLEDYRSIADLLSIKYEVSPQNATIILNEYIAEYDLFTFSVITGGKVSREKLLGIKLPLREFVVKMQEKTGESVKTLASFVFDLKLYFVLNQ